MRSLVMRGGWQLEGRNLFYGAFHCVGLAGAWGVAAAAALGPLDWGGGAKQTVDGP